MIKSLFVWRLNGNRFLQSMWGLLCSFLYTAVCFGIPWKEVFPTVLSSNTLYERELHWWLIGEYGGCPLSFCLVMLQPAEKQGNNRGLWQGNAIYISCLKKEVEKTKKPKPHKIICEC